jgi:hypothetical protein
VIPWGGARPLSSSAHPIPPTSNDPRTSLTPTALLDRGPPAPTLPHPPGRPSTPAQRACYLVAARPRPRPNAQGHLEAPARGATRHDHPRPHESCARPCTSSRQFAAAATTFCQPHRPSRPARASASAARLWPLPHPPLPSQLPQCSLLPPAHRPPTARLHRSLLLSTPRPAQPRVAPRLGRGSARGPRI